MMLQPATLPAGGVATFLASVSQLSAWTGLWLLVWPGRGMSGSKEPN